MIHISLLAVLTLVVFGCADRYSSDRPSHHEVYPQVLESISREVDLDHSLAVHPLLAHLDSIPGDTVLQMVSFSRYETHIVPALVGLTVQTSTFVPSRADGLRSECG